MLRIVHIADVHLGSKLNFLGQKAQQHRERIRESFAKGVKLAIEKKADLFLIAGDLFDSNYPAPDTLLFALNQIRKLTTAGIHVALMPGNHDCYSQDSVYRNNEWSELKSPLFKLFTTENTEAWEIAQLDTVVYAHAPQHKKSLRSPIAGFERIEATYQIGMFHGSVDIMGPVENYPLPVEKLKTLELDYIALGDWHSQLEVLKRPACWYSGSPELIASDQKGAGRILVVDINKGQELKIEPVALSELAFVEVEVDLSAVSSSLELIALVEKQLKQAEETILTLRLKGFRRLGIELALEAVGEHFRQSCYYAVVQDESELELSEEQLQQFSERLVIGNYIAFIREYEKKNPEQKGVAEQALQKGLNLLLRQQDNGTD